MSIRFACASCGKVLKAPDEGQLDGRIRELKLLGGNPILGDAAMAAVEQWVYSAGRSRTTTEVSIPFDAGR